MISNSNNRFINNKHTNRSLLTVQPLTSSLEIRRYLSSNSTNSKEVNESTKRKNDDVTSKKQYQPQLNDTNNNTDHFSVFSAYGWLMTSLKKDKSLSSIAVATIFMAGEGLMVNQPAVLLGRIVDEVGSIMVTSSSSAMTDTAIATTATITNTPTIWPLFTLIGASILCKELCTIGRKYLIEKSATSLQKTAFLEQAKHLLAVRVDALQDQRVGSLVVKLDKSVEGLIKLQKVTFLEGAPNVTAAVVALGYACSEHILVGTTMISVVIVGSIITTLQITTQKGIRINLNEKKAFMGANVVDLFNHLGYIRASGMRPMEEKRLEDIAEEVRTTEFRHHKWMMSFSGMRDVVEQGGFVLVVGGAVHLALMGDITSGSILTLAMLYSKATQPLQKMHKVVDGGHEAVIKVGIMGPLRNLPTDPGLDGTLQPQMNCQWPLVADNLTLNRLGVGGNNEKVVLQNLSVNLNRGEIIGIAGPSGSGKSTLLKCALGLIPDYKGSLTLLGVEALEADKSALSHAMLYAQQEPFVLTGSIRDNLLATCNDTTTTNTGYDDDDLILALERACLNPSSDFTDWKTHGLDTLIHEAGRNLSGGQRQRLALARIFLLLDKDAAQIVILDEATSALDNVIEAKVIDNLENMVKKRNDGGGNSNNKKMVIMVAHRLSTLRRADRVLVMDEGSIVQDGTYGQLENCDGPFRDLLEASRSNSK